MPCSSQPTTLPGSDDAAGFKVKDWSWSCKLDGERWESLKGTQILSIKISMQYGFTSIIIMGKMSPVPQTHNRTLCPHRSHCICTSTHEECFPDVSSTFRARRQRVVGQGIQDAWLLDIQKSHHLYIYRAHTHLQNMFQCLNSQSWVWER